MEITPRLGLAATGLVVITVACVVRAFGTGLEIAAGVLGYAVVLAVLTRVLGDLPRREPSRERTAASAMDVVTGIAEAWHRLGDGATYATVRGTASHVEGGLEIHDLSGVAFVASSSIHAMQRRGERFTRGGAIADGDVVVVTGPAWRRAGADAPAQYRGRAVGIELGDRGEDRVLVIRTAAATARVGAAVAT